MQKIWFLSMTYRTKGLILMKYFMTKGLKDRCAKGDTFL